MDFVPFTVFSPFFPNTFTILEQFIQRVKDDFDLLDQI